MVNSKLITEPNSKIIAKRMQSQTRQHIHISNFLNPINFTVKFFDQLTFGLFVIPQSDRILEFWQRCNDRSMQAYIHGSDGRLVESIVDEGEELLVAHELFVLFHQLFHLH